LAGTIVQHIKYVPFGEVFIEEQTSTWGTPYKFNAKELDEETGLYYYGARYLDPKLGVWLSVDPLAENHPEINVVYRTISKCQWKILPGNITMVMGCWMERGDFDYEFEEDSLHRAGGEYVQDAFIKWYSTRI
jgi:RHS repeat-associated protein